MNGLFSFYKKTSFLFSLFGTCAIISLLLKCVTEPCGVCYTSILIQKEKLSWIRILTFRCSLAISHLMKFRFFFLSFFFLTATFTAYVGSWARDQIRAAAGAYATATAIPDPNCICTPHCSLCQCQILNLLSEARDQTQILMDGI